MGSRTQKGDGEHRAPERDPLHITRRVSTKASEGEERGRAPVPRRPVCRPLSGDEKSVAGTPAAIVPLPTLRAPEPGSAGSCVL
jgi:hypothetical protein